MILKIIICRRIKRRNVIKRKKMWVRKLFNERRQKGEYNTLVKDLMLFDHAYFFKSFRMTPTRFEQLLSWVAPHIHKSSKIRDVATPSERLCITLRYLATGDAQTTIASSYRVSPPVVSRIIRETCSVIWTELQKQDYLAVPTSEESWQNIAVEFEEKWNFPNCLGAIDGKHIIMQAPPRSGSDYFNYKRSHSIVLMAVCDAKYEFTLVDIGDAGRQSDGGVYKNSHLGYAIDTNTVNRPVKGTLPSNGKEYPYVFVADDAFQLKTFMLKPFAQLGMDLQKKIFNYRLSRARRIIENCFGIAASRFRIFRRPIIASVETVIVITQAVVALHNFLMKSQRLHGENSYCPPGFTDRDDRRERRSGDWRMETRGFTGLVPLSSSSSSNNYTKSAKDIREDFKTYFNSPEGAVSWQWDYVNRTINPFDENL